MVGEPTHKQGNILDLVLTNQLSATTNVEVCSDSMPLASDHFPIFVSISNFNATDHSSNSKEVLNYSKTDICGLVDYFLDYDFSADLSNYDVDSLWNSVQTAVMEAVNKFTPRVHFRRHPNPKWFNSRIRHDLHVVHSLRKKVKNNPSDHNFKKLQDCELYLNLLMLNAKSTYEFDLA